jgi:hypothetical protein
LLPSVFSIARKGITSPGGLAPVARVVVFRTVLGCSAPVTAATSETAQTAVRIRDAGMEWPPAYEPRGFFKALILTIAGRCSFRR